MLTGTNVVVALMMVVGTVGVVLPILPGLLIVWAATLLWAVEVGSSTGWIVLGITSALYAGGLVTQYLVPGRRLRAAGVATPTLVVALLVAGVGFFVVPVVGGPLGFVAGIYLVEQLRYREHPRAWRATGQAVRAVMLSMGIELLTALAIMTTWLVAVWVSRP